MADRMELYARSGYLTAAIDCRYHGDRALPEAAGQSPGSGDPRSAYQDALVRCACQHAQHAQHSMTHDTARHFTAHFDNTLLCVYCLLGILCIAWSTKESWRMSPEADPTVQCVYALLHRGLCWPERDICRLHRCRAWRGSGERPFLLDNVWDLQVCPARQKKAVHSESSQCAAHLESMSRALRMPCKRLFDPVFTLSCLCVHWMQSCTDWVYPPTAIR